MTAALLTATAMTGPGVTAQTSYTCFPTCSTTDGRMLSLASTGIDAFAGNDITIGFGLPANATTLEIGIFDPDSKASLGYWDKGGYPLDYELYADPNGDGTNAVLLASFSGSTLDAYDNAWYTISRSVDLSARATNGNYVYFLRASMATGAPLGSRSSFKLRTNGTITVRSYQSFSIEAPLHSGREAGVIYPNYSLSTDPLIRYANPTYDGTWNIYLDVISPSSELTVWDGDLDHGTDPNGAWPGKPLVLPADTDDDDTPNGRPGWVDPLDTNCVAEGAAGASPYDDNMAIYNRRSPAIRYDVIFPDGTTEFANDNPSGSREWEQFKIGTGTFNRSVMDHLAASIPAGIYQVRVEGMDLLNVNAWRFFNNVVAVPGTSDVEVIGVNESGLPVAPIRAVETVNGSISGTVYYDSDEDQAQSAVEPGLPTVLAQCFKQRTDGSWEHVGSAHTTREGNFTFSKLGAGHYKVEIDETSLQDDVVPTVDADGTTTPHVAETSISGNSPNAVASFGYRRGADIGTLTRGYWLNHPENWPVQSLQLAGTSDKWWTKEELIEILKRPTKGDKSYSMAAQLIATKLNLANGTDGSCVASAVLGAESYLGSNPMNGGRTADHVWVTGAAYHQTLDDYNNGRLCVGHMD